MKKIFLTLFLAIPAMVFAQVKPSLPKAEKAWKEGKLDEAKTIIDATTSSQEFMVDKKGKPSKNAAKAWYIKGLIYFAMDTTKKEQFKHLDPNPFLVGKESFEKSKELEPNPVSYVNDQSGLPIITAQVNGALANNYFNKSIAFYNEKTGDIMYNYVHSMNMKGYPDTIPMDETTKYTIVANTIPQKKIHNVS